MVYRQQGYTSHLLHATKSDTALSSDISWSTCSETSSHVCQCKELQKEFKLLFHTHQPYVEGLGAFAGVMTWLPA